MAYNLKSTMAYKTIKDMIIDGTINNSTNLTETSISEMLGISRTPVRSALIKLQNDGLVKIMPNQGVTLRELSVKEAKDQYELRVLLERHMTQKSFPLLQKEDFNELKSILVKQEECISNNNYKEFLSLDDDFHNCCFKHNDNIAIDEAWNKCRNMLYYLRLLSVRQPNRLQKSYNEHLKIYEQLKKGLCKDAENSMIEHLNIGVLSMI